ncbi:MAG: hypothetical protein U0350_44630 [Caldilineaceae bacterium]
MPPIQTIYLIHHSHTDIGYTSDQPMVWDMHTRFIDEALDLAERYAASESDGAFRWTVETTAMLQYWLRHASSAAIDRLLALEKAGRVEVTGMYLNITPLYDGDQIIESLQPVGELRRTYGFDIRHAMNCDVNGENWPLVDLLLDAGIEGFTMAINTHFGGPVRPRPLPFLWQGPSGRTLPTYNGWTYDKGWTFGIGRSAEEFGDTWWPRAQRHLDQIGYPLPILMLQSFHPFGDNGTAFDFTPFIDAWNASGRTPRLVMATPRTWWAAVKEHTDKLTTLRGDWTDYWNFGAISSAREQTINRASRARLRTADALHAFTHPLAAQTQQPGKRLWSQQSYARYRAAAWQALQLWDEHTWGADIAVRAPESDDTASQWNHKAHYAYTARSLSLLLQRDGIADLARYIPRQAQDDLLIFNPLPWEQELSGVIRPEQAHPRGTADDGTAGRHHLDRQFRPHYTPEMILEIAQHGEQPLLLKPTKVPAFGFARLSRQALVVDGFEGPSDQPFHHQKIAKSVIKIGEAEMIENQRYRVRFDREHGGVVSLFDKALNCEWLDTNQLYPLHSFVHEEVADKTHDWPRQLLAVQDWAIAAAEIPIGWQTGWRAHRRRATAVVSHKSYHTPLGAVVLQTLQAPGTVGLLTQRLFLPNDADYVECEAWWEQGLNTHPEAFYLLFPFALPDATARFDLGGQAVVAGAEQLPGVCRDYFTAQNWVDLSNDARGVTVALPDNPMVMFDDFHFADYQQEFRLSKATLLGWASNNYWETNFRAHQPGRITSRYRLYPHAGPFDEAQAHRWGQETRYAELLVQPLCEPAVASPALPEQGALLQLPQAPVLTLHVKPADNGDGVIVRLLNASEQPQAATISSGIGRIMSAQQCDLFETVQADLAVVDGGITLTVEPRRVAVVKLEVVV